MKAQNRQVGMSMLGVLAIVGLTSFFLMVVIRLLPVYMEGRTVNTVLTAVVEAASPDESIGEINKRIVSAFITNQIDVMTPRDVKISRDKGTILVEANFEMRTPLFEGVDAVLLFNNNNFVID